MACILQKSTSQAAKPISEPSIGAWLPKSRSLVTFSSCLPPSLPINVTLSGSKQNLSHLHTPFLKNEFAHKSFMTPSRSSRPKWRHKSLVENGFVTNDHQPPREREREQPTGSVLGGPGNAGLIWIMAAVGTIIETGSLRPRGVQLPVLVWWFIACCWWMVWTWFRRVHCVLLVWSSTRHWLRFWAGIFEVLGVDLLQLFFSVMNLLVMIFSERFVQQKLMLRRDKIAATISLIC